ncbi:MAG: 50S ribosomal protein L35, partial [Anaerolineae bacterium]|nr:50S ribosomal protein L35 [Anaerolineae bacterium]
VDPAMKTNKSYTKRLRVTRTGKIIARAPGQNHFNAKESRSGRMRRRRSVNLNMSIKNRSRFLPH